MIYQLVTFGDEVVLTLAEAESESHVFAMRKLKAWADENGYQLAKSPDDTEANCVAQTLHFE
jgi:hypothetical protein